jgi:hypothetical protein
LQDQPVSAYSNGTVFCYVETAAAGRLQGKPTQPSLTKGVGMTFGIQDPCVAVAYLLAFAGALVCVAYGITHWNKDDEPVKPEDVQWAKDEKEEIEAAL